MKNDDKKKKAPTVDPKKSVQVIELDHLENVVGGLGGEEGDWSEGLEGFDDIGWNNQNRRMSTEA